jgi:hypothetical protein
MGSIDFKSWAVGFGVGIGFCLFILQLVGKVCP